MQSLPVELILQTAQYLECRDLMKFSESCKDLQDIVDGSNLLWRDKLFADFPSQRISSKDYKKHYISNYKSFKNWNTGNFRVHRISSSHSTRMRTILLQENYLFYVQEDYTIIMHNVATQESIRLMQEHEPVCMYKRGNKLWVADLKSNITGKNNVIIFVDFPSMES